MDFKKVTDSLRGHGFKVLAFEAAAQAVNYLNMQIDGKTVAFGGSVTLEELNLYGTLCAHNTVISHWHVPEGKTANELRTAAMSTEVYISSVNGIAETGEIVNIDGGGNRVASILYGHKKIYLVVGKNKIVQTYDEALWRARNIAAPKNAQRLHRKTPCAVSGDRCYNCKSPERICRALAVLWEPPMGTETEIILVDKNLGF